MDVDKFTDAYDTRTGEKRLVPTHYLDHPVLGKGLSRTPRDAAKTRGNAPAGNRPAGKATPASGDQDKE